jgi:hypothetical protein
MIRVSKNLPEIEIALSALKADGRQTNLAAAFEETASQLKALKHTIRSVDVITDGLSNEGNPILPATILRKEYNVYLHIYLIDPTHEGMRIAEEVIGVDGEGEIDPIVSSGALQKQQLNALTRESQELEALHKNICRHTAERTRLLSSPVSQNRPRVTAAFPQSLKHNVWRSLDVFIYLKDFANLVRTKVRRLGIDEGLDYGQIDSEFRNGLKTGCPITVGVYSDHVLVNPESVTIRWFELYNQLTFRVCPKSSAPLNTPVSIEVEVLADQLPVAAMTVPVFVGEEISEVVESRDVRWFDDIFASYAREDLPLVRHLRERYDALGLRLFIDADDLRGGVKVRPALFHQIEQSDLFQLFWSKHSKQSKEVALEWRHALTLRSQKGGRFIRPVFWERPMPSPPRELADINFRGIEFWLGQNEPRE